MTQRGGKGLGGEPKRKRKATTGQRTVSKISTDRKAASTAKSTVSKSLKSGKFLRPGPGVYVTPASSAPFDKSRSQAPKEPGRDSSKSRKNPPGSMLIEVLRAMVRPYKVSLSKSLRSPKIRTTSSRTRTILYVDNDSFDRLSNDPIPLDDEISVSVYVDTDDQSKIDHVLSQVAELRSLAGYGEEYDVVVVRGSIFHRAKSALMRGVSSKEVSDRLTKIERAFEIAYLDNKQAEVDSAEAEAVQRLLESVQNIDRACIRAGSILLIKFQVTGENVVLVRNLSQLEIRALERYPEIQARPETVLPALATAVESMASLNAVNTAERQIPGSGTSSSL